MNFIRLFEASLGLSWCPDFILASMKDERLGLCRWNWKDPRGWEKDVYAWVRGRALRLWMMPVVLLCVFVAAEEWSESEMSRDMWPSFPGMLELCGTLSGYNNVEIPDSDEFVKHNSFWLRNQHNDYSFRFTLPNKSFEKVSACGQQIAFYCSWMFAQHGANSGALCSGSTHSNGSTRRCWCWKPFQKLLWPLKLCNLQVSIFLYTFLCDAESTIITLDEHETMTTCFEE